jgi:hypothetical protein
VAFEEAVKKLEKIVEEMESGELPLESMLSRFEEGTRPRQGLPKQARGGGIENPKAGEKTLPAKSPSSPFRSLKTKL